jgi:hypothetical protein
LLFIPGFGLALFSGGYRSNLISVFGLLKVEILMIIFSSDGGQKKQIEG